jgi:cell wall-associated NlpC family hydrolase
LRGEIVSIFEDHEGWVWVQAERDGYVGYASASGLSPAWQKRTHRIIVPRTFAYREPDVKCPTVCSLSVGSDVTVVGQTETRGAPFYALDDGTHIFARHLAAIERSKAEDHVAVARSMLGTPYLWGGTSAFGLDCSGLVQLALRMCGISVARDTDMQATSIGTEIDPGPRYEKLRRGDLIFWKGHVAIMLDVSQLVHASGTSMLVTCEPLEETVARIGALYGPPTVCRRP